MRLTRDTTSARFMTSMTQAAKRMNDTELEFELSRVRRCVLCMTRSRRELAQMQIYCLECELENRARARTPEA